MSAEASGSDPGQLAHLPKNELSRLSMWISPGEHAANGWMRTTGMGSSQNRPRYVMNVPRTSSNIRVGVRKRELSHFITTRAHAVRHPIFCNPGRRQKQQRESTAA